MTRSMSHGRFCLCLMLCYCGSSVCLCVCLPRVWPSRVVQVGREALHTSTDTATQTHRHTYHPLTTVHISGCTSQDRLHTHPLQSCLSTPLALPCLVHVTSRTTHRPARARPLVRPTQQRSKGRRGGQVSAPRQGACQLLFPSRVPPTLCARP
jgi:hypothetical protein